MDEEVAAAPEVPASGHLLSRCCSAHVTSLAASGLESGGGLPVSAYTTTTPSVVQKSLIRTLQQSLSCVRATQSRRLCLHTTIPSSLSLFSLYDYRTVLSQARAPSTAAGAQPRLAACRTRRCRRARTCGGRRRRRHGRSCAHAREDPASLMGHAACGTLAHAARRPT